MTIRAIVFLGIIASLVGCQSISQRQDMEVLDKAQVLQLFQGQTVESFNLNTGTTSFSYYNKDGSLLQQRYWQQRQGKWQVNGTGEMCLAMEGKPEACRPIVNNQGKIYKYRRDDKQQLEKIIRYRQFIAGNAL